MVAILPKSAPEEFFARARMEIGTVAWWELLIWFLRWEMFGAPADLRSAVEQIEA